MMRRDIKTWLIAIGAWLTAGGATAQESQEVYSFLRLPVSAHAAALGGDNITMSDDDPTVIFHNPSRISNVSDKSINLNFMTYMEGAITASASFVKALKERATWGVSAQFMSYGSIKETNTANEQTGTFSPKDIAVAGSFAYMLTNSISGGVTMRFISSTIGSYSSAAVGVDLGLNYFHEDKGWSVSLVAKNLGGQVKAYHDDFERIPFDLQAGVSKRFEALPVTLHATFSRLTNWEQGFGHHLAIGADLRLSQQLYLAVGYNFRRNSEMKLNKSTDSESSHGAGLSLGAGLQLERFKLQVGYAKYHVSAYSLLGNITYTL